jgi:endonuclease YncB( thermonuclease family)
MPIRAFAAIAAALLWIAGASTAPPVQAEDARFSLCADMPYRSCVRNGDLIYIRGQRIRLSDIVTPDRYTAACPAASNIAWYAAIRMRDLLNEQPYDVLEDPDNARTIEAGKGELIRRIERDGRSLGAVLVDEGLARRRTPAGHDWCSTLGTPSQ